jgi:hypothetical protein
MSLCQNNHLVYRLHESVVSDCHCSLMECLDGLAYAVDKRMAVLGVSV